MKARKVEGLGPEVPLRESAARIVLARVCELRSFASGALKPDSSTDQHDMRIAAKRLRYVLELTGFCLGDAAETGRKRARDLQGLLGELHDCDVMLPRIDRHLADLRAADAEAVRARAGADEDLAPELAARAPHRTAYRGLEVLTVYLEARRALLHERFAAFWAEQESAGTWERLEAAAGDALRH